MKTSKREIRNKKLTSDLLHKIEEDMKPSHCLLCGKKSTSFCNSHVVPQFILKEIAENGELYYGQSLYALNDNTIQTKSGIKNAFPFRLICKECDQKRFSTYESPKMITDFDIFNIETQKKILCEMAIKAHLAHLNTKMSQASMLRIVYPIENIAIKSLGIKSAYELDIEEHRDYIKKLSKYEKEKTFPFVVLYNKLFDWVSPIATQTIIAHVYDLNGNMIFNPTDLAKSHLSKYTYLMVLPYHGKTRILFYVEKSNMSAVKTIVNDFNSLSDKEKLDFLFVSLMTYDEQFYIKPSVRELMVHDRKLIKLYKSTESKNGNWSSCKKLSKFRDYTNYFLPLK